MIKVEGTELSLRRITLFSTEHVWESLENSRDDYEILYVVKGNLFVEESILYSMTEGNMIVLKPRKTKRKYSCTPNSIFFWIRFSVDDVEKLTGGTYLFTDVQDAYLFKEMLHHYRVYKDNPVLAELILAQLLVYNKEIIRGTGTRKLVAEVCEMIRLNASPTLKIEDIASLYGYNKEHLTRLMKKEYGKGLKEIINYFTIKACKKRLLNTNYSIKEIGVDMKFDDTESFVKFFKYHEGITPSQYRERFVETGLQSPASKNSEFHENIFTE